MIPSSSSRPSDPVPLVPSREDLGEESPGDVSDAVLLEQIRAGQTEAWEILIGRYERLVYSVALRNGLSWNDAMDVTQNTFTIFLESYTTLRCQESLASWLMTVARRQSWRTRQQTRREEVVADLARPGRSLASTGSRPPRFMRAWTGWAAPVGSC